jgi:hypothetical protein
MGKHWASIRLALVTIAPYVLAAAGRGRKACLCRQPAVAPCRGAGIPEERKPMTPEDRQVITGIFERLQAAESHPRDPEAEKLIAELVAKQPYAPYAMAQSVYVGEQALANLNRRVEELEQQLQEAQSRPQSGGFLSSLFGGPKAEPPRQDPRQDPRSQDPRGQDPRWQDARLQDPRYGDPRQGYAPAQPGYPPAGPWGGQPGGGQPQGGGWGGQPQGGGFLQSAMTTAAGVAGGMVLANVLTNAFSHQAGSGLGSGLGSLGSFGSTPAAAQGFGGTQTNERTDGSSQDSNANSASSGSSFSGSSSSDRDRPVDAAYDRSDSSSHDGSSDNGSSDDDSGGFDDDSGFSDDGGFSGDV